MARSIYIDKLHHLEHDTFTSEEEKLFSYCEEKLRLLVEHPHEDDSLIERLVTIRNCCEVLFYKLTLIKEK